MFQSIGSFFAGIWNNGIKPAIGAVWHVVGGAVIGAATPTLTMMGKQVLAGQPVDLKGAAVGIVGTAIGALIGAGVGWLQHSNNQTVAGLAGQITPDMQAQLDAQINAKVSAAIQSIKVPK